MPHCDSASRTGLSVLPSEDKEYSTLGKIGKGESFIFCNIIDTLNLSFVCVMFDFCRYRLVKGEVRSKAFEYWFNVYTLVEQL